MTSHAECRLSMETSTILLNNFALLKSTNFYVLGTYSEFGTYSELPNVCNDFNESLEYICYVIETFSVN